MPENKDVTPGEIGHTLVKKTVLISHTFERLILISHTFERVLLRDASCGLLISSTDSNNCSSKQDTVKQAEVLGVSVRTMEKWIDKLVQSTDIERVTHGQYQKRDCKIA